MKRLIYQLAAGLILGSLMIPAGAADGPALSILYAGSWEHAFLKKGSVQNSGGAFINRADLRLHANLPRIQELSARFQVIDKRLLIPLDKFSDGNTALSAGLYHKTSGSRLLYGVLDEWGLPARLRNPWGKAAPFAENRLSALADLKTAPSASGEREAYLSLRSPRLGMFRFFASGQVSEALVPGFSGGGDLQLAPKTRLGLEGFYTAKRLAPRTSSSWFSAEPPLPERNFALYGLNCFFNTPMADFSFDGAYSETFAWGSGVYAGGAIRLGSHPWQVSLAADGADSRFTDRRGISPGAGFRTAFRFDWKERRNGLFRTALLLRAPEPGELFNRGTITFTRRFPRSPGFIPWKAPVQPAKVSLSLERDAADADQTLDSAELSLSLDIGPVKTEIGAVLGGIAEGAVREFPLPGAAAAYRFDSAKTSLEAAYSPGLFQFKADMNCVLNSKGPVWGASLSGAARFKNGRFSLKISSPALPGSWQYALSWRITPQGKQW